MTGIYLVVYAILFVIASLFIWKSYKLKQIIKRLELDLREERREFEILFNSTDLQVWYFKDDKSYGAANQAHLSFWNKNKEEIKDKNLYDIYPQNQAKKLVESNQRILANMNRIEKDEWVKNGQGEKRLLKVIKIPKKVKGEKYLICYAYDLTKQRLKEQQIKEKSYKDSLTGLYNRSYYETKYQNINQAKNLPLSIIIGDLNGLKLANDVFGHKAGDNLLEEASQILQSSIRQNDLLIRWGGDEFCILLPNTNQKWVKKILKRIKDKCQNSPLDPFPPEIALGFATQNHSDEELDDIFTLAEERMYKDKSQSKNDLDNTILKSLMDRLLNNGYEEAAHIERVREMAVDFGHTLGLSEYLINRLALLAEFHDIGKLTLPSDLLNKRDSLNQKELQQLRDHIVAGYHIAKNFQSLNSVSELILYHHENWDGSGFPEGLAKEKIPLLSRILRIVDAYDVLLHGRPYKAKLSKKETLDHLKEGSGSKYDPNLTRSFIKFLDKQN